ncbi:MAG: hypothetical protein OFPI_05600 [Osedax symbiont Rs2]|nr:MAG: hypothetical protein OFPI_05600 [Osedax symbiont Rs2]
MNVALKYHSLSLPATDYHFATSSRESLILFLSVSIQSGSRTIQVPQ